MNKHPKGPWRIVEGRRIRSLEIFSGNKAILEIHRRGDAGNELALVSRIVACVNTYEGFSTEELQGVDLLKERDDLLAELKATESRLHEVATFCATIEQQRDELIAALKRWIWLRDTPAGFIGKYGKALREAVDEREAQLSEAEAISRAAIAKAGGES